MKTQPIAIAISVMLAMASFNLAASPAKAQPKESYIKNKYLGVKLPQHPILTTTHLVARPAKIQPKHHQIKNLRLGRNLAQHPNFDANPALMNADKAREAKEIKEIQELNKLQQARATLAPPEQENHGATTNPLTAFGNFGTGSTSGTGISGIDSNHILGNSNTGHTPQTSSLPNAQDCINDPKSCFHSQGNSTTKLGMFSNSVNLLDKPPENNTESDKPQETPKQEKTEYPDHPEPGEISIEGAEQAQEITTEMAIHHNGGDRPAMGDDGSDGTTGATTKPDKKPVDLTHTKDGQPDPNSGTVVGSTTHLIKDCIPGSGPCKEKHKTTHQEMTGQPVYGDRTQSGGTNSTVAGKVMGFAVNPDPVGDNSQGGGGGGGQPVSPGRNASFAGFAGNGVITH